MLAAIDCFAIVLCLTIEYAAASYCYPDYCQNLTDLVPTPGFQCLLTRVQRGEGCEKLTFEDANERPSKQDTAVFTLHAYVINFEGSPNKATAFNLSVSDINFHRLITRYQNLVDESVNACRRIELYGNRTHPLPKHLYVSCPFSDAAFEGSPYRLEYRTTGEDGEYSKKYVFYVPRHEHIGKDAKVETYTPFIYVDTSHSTDLALYIQPLPARYNVTEYKVWLIHNDTGTAIGASVRAREDGRHMRYNLTTPGGVYYVKVAALDPKCGELGCVNSTSPYIHIKQASNRLLIMIISTIWIPPVILYALYHIFKLYKKRAVKRMARKPNCLLVYSPTHPAHVSVMAELAKYLRCCNINAMIDVFDIAQTVSKDPGLWCDTAFQTADVVLVATSPSSSTRNSTTVYQNIDNHLLRLLKENYPRRNKRYYAVHLPYCKPDGVPEEARLFKKFRVPEELSKLVKAIHDIGYLRFAAVPENELLDSVKFAKVKIFEDEASGARSTDETDDLLSPITVREITDHDAERPVEVRAADTSQTDVVPQSFATNIDELNLLGETNEVESLVYKRATSDCEFRIDQLNL